MVTWSHSKLNCILSNPMEYYLNYIQGIKPVKKAAALSIGSAVHWGIEHNTEVLDEYTEDDFRQRDNYTEEQVLAESMIHGYLTRKNEIFDQILTDLDGSKLTLEEEIHELKIETTIASKVSKEPNKFLGIIDLLLLTNKGFIIVDYKTSSKIPNWDDYIEQLYRYIYLVKQEFPEIPIVKIGIINLRKSMIRQKKNENDLEFLNRLKLEYDINEDLIEYHEFLPQDIDENLMSDYIDNLSKMIDFGEMIHNSQLWYINYTNANGMYKSQYLDIFYQTPGAEALYKISDTIWDEDENKFNDVRDCIGLDMSVIKNKNVLNHYETYKIEKENCKSMNDIRFNNYLKNKYIVDNNLLNKYKETYLKEVSLNEG